LISPPPGAWGGGTGVLRVPAIRDVAFYLGVGSLFAHELDAVPNHEWRGLPLVGALSDDTAMAVFIAAHVPLFAILIALIASENARIRMASRYVIAIFLLVHGFLHLLSSGEPTYEFSSTLSHLLIFSAAAFGALYLVLSMRQATSRVP
jgi:hypothetical protein